MLCYPQLAELFLVGTTTISSAIVKENFKYKEGEHSNWIRNSANILTREEVSAKLVCCI